MIVKDELLAKLRRYFGLNLYEAKIWAALLSRGVSTAGELSDIANVPRSRSYDVLESIEKKGLVVQKIGKPIKYIAISPKEVVERVKKNLKKEAHDKIERLNELKDSDLLIELNSLHSQGVEMVEASDMTGSLKGRHNLYDHLEHNIKNAEKSVTLMTSTEGLMRKADALQTVFEDLNKKGVNIRIAAPITDDLSGVVSNLKGIADVRHIDDMNARFTITDSKDLTFMVMNDGEVHPTYDLGIWVNTPYFSQAVEHMFEQKWKNAPSAESFLSQKAKK